MARNSQITIGWLMLIVGNFAVLFSLPTPVLSFLAALILPGVFAGGSAKLLSWLRMPQDECSDSVPKDISIVGTSALFLEVTTWIVLAMLIPAFEHFTSLQLALIVLGVSCVGTFSHVQSLVILFSPSYDDGSELKWKFLAFLIALTSWPFFLALHVGVFAMFAMSSSK